MHPHSELRRVSDGVGFGVFATRPIPRGTLVYVKDSLEIVLGEREYLALARPLREIADRYSYIDPSGDRILSWDLAKYVNHRCDCNSMSTGWGFEIALRDIEAGEEITDEYGLLNVPEPMALACGCRRCRMVLHPDDGWRLYRNWDRRVRRALGFVPRVDQPLLRFVDAATRRDLEAYLRGERPYRSVRTLLRPGEVAVAPAVVFQRRAG